MLNKILVILFSNLSDFFARIQSFLNQKAAKMPNRLAAFALKYSLVWSFAGIVFVLVSPSVNSPFMGPNAFKINAAAQSQNSPISGFFTSEIRYWEPELIKWGNLYHLDPNLLATVMQIESCGHPSIGSSAGAQGLFQVMPFHFAQGENPHDPDTNAYRSATVLQSCSEFAAGDVGLTLACYNGGPSVVYRPFHEWPDETQRYYIWGMGIYGDTLIHAENSIALNKWLEVGGSGLCQLSASVQMARSS
ncbi:hypothetical protein MASR2M15_22670 [Anaerolineales bacterium]